MGLFECVHPTKSLQGNTLRSQMLPFQILAWRKQDLSFALHLFLQAFLVDSRIRGYGHLPLQ